MKKDLKGDGDLCALNILLSCFASLFCSKSLSSFSLLLLLLLLLLLFREEFSEVELMVSRDADLRNESIFLLIFLKPQTPKPVTRKRNGIMVQSEVVKRDNGAKSRQ